MKMKYRSNRKNKEKTMKTILIMSCLTLYAHASITWSQVMSWKDKTINPDAQYSIETEGFNVRVYEFTPLTDPGSLCIMTFTNEKMGTYCFRKSEQALKKEDK